MIIGSWVVRWNSGERWEKTTFKDIQYGVAFMAGMGVVMVLMSIVNSMVHEMSAFGYWTVLVVSTICGIGVIVVLYRKVPFLINALLAATTWIAVIVHAFRM